MNCRGQDSPFFFLLFFFNLFCMVDNWQAMGKMLLYYYINQENEISSLFQSMLHYYNFFFFFNIDDTNRIWKKFSIPLDSSCPMWVFPDLKKNYETSRILLTLIPSQMCVYTYLICLNFIYIYIYYIYSIFIPKSLSLSYDYLSSFSFIFTSLVLKPPH